MPAQDTLFDLFDEPPEKPAEQPAPAETPEPRANPPEVQARIDALIPCRACGRRTGREWAAFSGGLCMVCSPVDDDTWMDERRAARRKATAR